MKQTHLSIAGISITIQGALSGAEMGLLDRYGPFLARDHKGDCSVLVRWREGDASQAPPGVLAYDPGDLWRVYKDSDNETIYVPIQYPAPALYGGGIALLEANPTWDDLVMIERCGGQGWRSLLNLGAGELILRTRIILDGGLVLHACGLDDNGRGLLFIGHSGAGKSTQAALWAVEPGVILLGTDRIAVRLHDYGPVAYGTPWGGEHQAACNRSAPVAAIFLLEQAGRNAAHRLSGEDAAPRMLACSFLPYWDSGLMDSALQLVEVLLESTPVYLLECRPEPDLVALVRAIL
jgi:hypothetical protein